MHDLCFFFIIQNSENAVSQIYIDAKGINMSKVAFEITEYSWYRNLIFIKSDFKI